MSTARLEPALDDLVAGRSPRSHAKRLDTQESGMLRAAQLLRGSVEEAPDPTFSAQLRGLLTFHPARTSGRRALAGAHQR